MKLKMLASAFAIAASIAPMAFAQSSGNFSAAGTSASCVIGDGGVLGGGTSLGSFTANISTGSGNGTTLDIRPGLVTGLFTDTKINTTISTSSADVGTQVCVTVDGSAAGVLPNPLCNFDLILSTLSAHSFDFVVSVDNKKPHVVDASWSIIGAGVKGSGSVASCVGPGVLTVTQTKVFNNSGALTFTSN